MSQYIYEVYLCESGEIMAITPDDIKIARRVALIVFCQNAGRAVSFRRVEGSLDSPKYETFKTLEEVSR